MELFTSLNPNLLHITSITIDIFGTGEYHV